MSDPMDKITDAEIDAGARALREHQMAGRITREWNGLPNSDRRKWRFAAAKVLAAAQEIRDRQERTP